MAAAYAGSLPGALQKIAHEAIAAPAPREGLAAPAPEGTGRPAGPSVTGGAAYGLCHAYLHAEEHGTASQQAVAFRNLVNAAGGAGQVAASCALVPHPGAASPPGRGVGQTSPGHGRNPSSRPGKPASPPGKPTSPPGKPTTGPGNGDGNGNGNGK
jgi:hypothetical protein